MGSTQTDVAVSYDVDNEFFRLWLDERMSYTCALFDDADLATPTAEDGRPAGNLEQAQLRKLAWLHDAARVTPDASVLDIGCGWGANLEYLTIARGVRDAHGITLSPAQHAEITRRALPNVTSQCLSYVDYVPERKFDAVISICMMEHICSPDEARAGKAIDMYRDYFRRVWEWTRPGAWFGLQTILRNRVPRTRQDIRDVGWMTYTIFPGGITPRLEEIVDAVNPYWEIVEVQTRRLHYQRTCEHWRARLRDHRELIETRWGTQLYTDYDRYLTTCIRAFAVHYQSLAQYALRRIDA
ncbi:MAG TPA: class I SAM-dependent methyltransferase [Kofleriaceae bacterium]|nr:class I SAM-dependent methyltransferase [Kofleriaceae bacterium]